MEQNLDFQRARALLVQAVQPLEAERTPLECAFGRVLAEEVTASRDVPPFARSPFDGYAFRGSDSAGATEEAPVTLRILEEIPAGTVGRAAVTDGTAAKILTGAPIPPGADTVCKFEDTVFTAESVQLRRAYRPGSNIAPAGEDLRVGDLVAAAGSIIDPAMAGSLATQGMAAVPVRRRPRAAVITTGSELRDAGDALDGGKIVNSNRYWLEAALFQAGCVPRFHGSPGDRVADIAACLESALAESDLVVTTGGVSVGDYDLTPAALEAVGVELLIENLDLKPGGKCCFGKKDGRLVCCLSGNPASAMTCFLAVCLPAVYRLTGRSACIPSFFTVLLGEDFPKKSPKTRLLRGVLDHRDGQALMHVSGEQGNGILHTMIGCNLLAVVPAGSGPLPAGSPLTAFGTPE